MGKMERPNNNRKKSKRLSIWKWKDLKIIIRIARGLSKGKMERPNKWVKMAQFTQMRSQFGCKIPS